MAKQLLFAGVSFIPAVKVMARACVMLIVFNNLCKLTDNPIPQTKGDFSLSIHTSQAEHEAGIRNSLFSV